MYYARAEVELLTFGTVRQWYAVPVSLLCVYVNVDSQPPSPGINTITSRCTVLLNNVSHVFVCVFTIRSAVVLIMMTFDLPNLATQPGGCHGMYLFSVDAKYEM